MHRPLMLGIAAAAAVLIVSLRTTAASERSTAGGLMTAKRTAMRLVERENLPPTPIGPEGAIFTGNLYDRTNETRVGRDQGVCFNTTPGMAQCTLTIFLGNSQIVLAGGMSTTGQGTIAVVGGTSLYAGAQGSASRFHRPRPTPPSGPGLVDIKVSMR